MFIYPNPNQGRFKIAVPNGMEIEQVNLFDQQGRMLKKINLSKTENAAYEVEIYGLMEAVYNLQIFTNSGEIVRRIIIDR